jgi:hypothetical protein
VQTEVVEYVDDFDGKPIDEGLAQTIRLTVDDGRLRDRPTDVAGDLCRPGPITARCGAGVGEGQEIANGSDAPNPNMKR